MNMHPAVAAASLPSYPQTPGFKEQAGTSQEAAEATDPRVEDLKDQILGSLSGLGPGTADEVATRLGFSILSIRPRFSELKVERLIRKTTTRRKNASGHTAVVWELVPPVAPWGENGPLKQCQASLGDGECIHDLCPRKGWDGPNPPAGIPDKCPLPWGPETEDPYQ